MRIVFSRVHFYILIDEVNKKVRILFNELKISCKRNIFFDKLKQQKIVEGIAIHSTAEIPNYLVFMPF